MAGLQTAFSVSLEKTVGVSNGARIVGATKKVAPPKKAAVSRNKRVAGGPDRYIPGAKRPEWLDGSMIGDFGFDPLGFAKPPEYLQFDLDSLDQNLGKNSAGDVIGVRKETKAEVNPTPFQPYAEVFSVTRFRENEIIHGRWAMLGVLGALTVEAVTGVAWQDAGKVELEQGASYFGFALPFSITALVWIEVLLIGYIEFARNSELNLEKRLYPGGYFDPLGLASNSDTVDYLKLAEIQHCRLAMVAAFAFAVQAAVTGAGPLENLSVWVSEV